MPTSSAYANFLNDVRCVCFDDEVRCVRVDNEVRCVCVLIMKSDVCVDKDMCVDNEVRRVCFPNVREVFSSLVERFVFLTLTEVH